MVRMKMTNQQELGAQEPRLRHTGGTGGWDRAGVRKIDRETSEIERGGERSGGVVGILSRG